MVTRTVDMDSERMEAIDFKVYFSFLFSFLIFWTAKQKKAVIQEMEKQLIPFHLF